MQLMLVNLALLIIQKKCDVASAQDNFAHRAITKHSLTVHVSHSPSRTGVGNLQPTGRMRPASRSCAARQAPRGKNDMDELYYMYLCLSSSLVRPATIITTLCRPAVVKRFPTTDLEGPLGKVNPCGQASPSHVVFLKGLSS